ncbi:MAG: asparagine synthase (glutamine-hydrolyzing) [Chloroflexi bacterium]|nr:asparagine synthase (glutamine-hydrolyzing) [Chloroflexota bacterium]
MCGIVGIVAPNFTRAELERANDLLAHRGPDEAGMFVGDGVGIAARRLSIIDLTSGHQPISNEDDSLHLVCNGEIFNAPDLRAQLERKGHRFKTHTDIETILHAYEEWGDDAVTHLRGMFAFAIWDTPQQKLFLARDRFGVKPLYYTHQQNKFIFASEIRPLLQFIAPCANLNALHQLFTLGFIPSPLTAFAHIVKLPAAHTLTYHASRITLFRYWRLIFNHQPINLEAASEKFIELLQDSVAAWRLSDVAVGSLLSGGVDSAALAFFLNQLSSAPIHTFTIGFTAATHDESAAARETARALGSHHHELMFSSADFDHLPKVISYLEEPQCSATSVPIYLVYKACHDAGFKVILTGEGADEILGGYHWFDGDRRVRQLLFLPQPLRALIARSPIQMSAPARRVLENGTDDHTQRYFLWHQLADAKQLSTLLQSPISNLQSPITNSQLHPLDSFLLLESQTRMIDFINFEVDRMSMANSVEARPPFLDHHLWEFCATLPPDCKLSPNGNKLLLRAGMKGKLPDAVVNQPKRGLATPHADWWRGSRLPAWAEEAIHPSAIESCGYFNSCEVGRLREEHQKGKADHSRLLIGVLTTQLWHDEFLL